MNQPLFELNAGASLGRVTSTFCERGTQYGDSWRNNQFLTMRAVLADLRVEIPSKYLRAIAAAALVDTKYQRMEGGYKDDNLIDGIAYSAFLAEEMRRVENEKISALPVTSQF